MHVYNAIKIHIGRSLCGLAVFGALGIAACGGKIDDGTGAIAQQAVTGSDAGLLTISGHVTDSSGNAVGTEVLISLTGSAQTHTFSNAATGAYSLSVKPGSYSITASTQCPTFNPGVVNLNNLTANTTVDFLGSGNDVITNCEALASVGGTSGTLTLSGHVTSAGHPVPGAKIVLSGSSQGFRYSDESGAYSFMVNPGSYSLNTSGACNSFAPSVVNLNNLKTSKTEEFLGSGNCPPAPLSLCPLFDTDFQLASLGDVCAANITTNSCADRLFTWQFNMLIDLPAFNGTDCRFGKFGPPLLSSLDVSQTIGQLSNFILYFMGCPYVGTQIGPLVDGLVPQVLLSRGVHFTTADLQALSDDYVAAIKQTLSDNGSPPLTSAQLSAIQAQLAFLASKVPGTVNSSTLTFSTCAH
jgi:hypothetical protein